MKQNLMRQNAGAMVAVVLICCIAGTLVSAERQPQASQKKAARKAADKTVSDDSSVRQNRVAVKLTQEQEAEAMAFAAAHHEELANLLKQLKNAKSPEFIRAVRELHTAQTRINRFREKQPQRYENELEAWKIDSEVRLRIVRWAMSKDPELEKQIRELLTSRENGKLNRLRLEQTRLRQRLKAISAQLESGEQKVAEQVNSEWDRLTKRVATARKNRSRDAATAKGKRSGSADKPSTTK